MNTFWKVVAAFFVTIFIGLGAYVIRFKNGPDRFSHKIGSNVEIDFHPQVVDPHGLLNYKSAGENMPVTTKGSPVSIPQSTAKFCVKVVPFGDDWNDPYSIQFSSDGEVFEELLEVLDTKKYTGKSGMLLYQTLLEKDKKTALKLARGLKSYDDCLHFNEKVKTHYEALVAKYERNPPKPLPIFQEPKHKPARTESIVYCE